MGSLDIDARVTTGSKKVVWTLKTKDSWLSNEVI